MRNWLFLPSGPDLFLKGRAKNKLFGTKAFKSRCLALRIDFNNLKRNSQAGFCTSLLGSCPVCHPKGVKAGFCHLFCILVLACWSVFFLLCSIYAFIASRASNVIGL